MPKLEFYVCHAGQNIADYVPAPDCGNVLGVVGCVYAWDGAYIRSPQDCIDNDKMAIMEFKSLADGTACWASLDCFTKIESSDHLKEWGTGI